MRIDFASLPDDARLWVFAASEAITGERAELLLRAVDDYLGEWEAHGEPLRCARDWRDDHFLVLGVDQSTAGASGCSIDGMFRVLQRLQSSLGATLVAGGRVYFRGRDGAVHVVSRPEFAALARSGAITDDTAVFDTSLTSAGDYRAAFERPVRDSWHRTLVLEPARRDPREGISA